MIKFFRKIRKKLLVENRFNKYLLYAIGEIVLVVIGILIALQINNWNSLRIDNKEKFGLTKSIREELLQNLAEFKERKEELQKLNYSTNLVLTFSAGYNDTISIDSLKETLQRIILFPSVRFKTTILSSAKSSGKIYLLDEELRVSLKDFEISLDNYEKYLDVMNNSFLDEEWYVLVLKLNITKEFHETFLQTETAKLHPDLVSSKKELITYLKHVKTYKYIYKILNERIIEAAWLSELIIRLQSSLQVIEKQVSYD